MIDEKFASLRTRRNNIARYRRLLETKLTDFERQFIERRLSQEGAALERLAASTFPLAFKIPKQESPMELAASSELPAIHGNQDGMPVIAHIEQGQLEVVGWGSPDI
jgi:hypothetical protein